ncbi:MAG: lyase family protein [Propionicimonas sp.]
MPAITDTPLYGEQTRLTVATMSFSGRRLADYPEFVRAAAQVKAAAAAANAAAGLLDAGKAARIATACDSLAAGEHLDQFPVDVFHGGGGIGLNMNLNEVIASLAGPWVDPADDVNLSQSTTDICHTALRLAVHGAVAEFRDALEALIGELDEVTRRAEGTSTIARTCLQDGLPVAAGVLYSALAHALRRQQRRLADSVDDLLQVTLGGTVIGSGAGAQPQYRDRIVGALGESTGLNVTPARDLYDATQYPDDLARLSGGLAIASHLLAKFAGDLRLLSSGPECGLGEISLPATQAGSSFFPGKVNPVIPEMVIQCDLLVTGNDATIQRCLGLGELHLNLWDSTMGFLLLDNLRMLTRAVTLFATHCVQGIQIDAQVCEDYARATMPSLVRLKDELGYQAVSDGIKEHGAAVFVRHHKHPIKERS